MHILIFWVLKDANTHNNVKSEQVNDAKNQSLKKKLTKT